MNENEFNEHDFQFVPVENQQERINLSRLGDEPDLFYELALNLSYQQLSIALLCQGGYSETQIAKLIKCSVKTVSKQKARIKDKVKKLYKA